MVSHKDNDAHQTKTARSSYDSPAESLRKALLRASADREECVIYRLEPCENKVEKIVEAFVENLNEDSSDPETPPGGGDDVAVSATRTRLGVPTSEGVPDAWIADTGSGYNLVSKNEVSRKLFGQIEVSSSAPTLRTANGEVKPNECVPVKLGPLPQLAYPLLMSDSPAFISVGKRCMEDGYGFYSPPGRNPYFVQTCGKVCSPGCPEKRALRIHKRHNVSVPLD
jgi:hypothetical protein